MTYQLFLEKNSTGKFHGFLISVSDVWDCYQNSKNTRQAIIDYYQNLFPFTDAQGVVLLLSIDQWKVMAKSISASLYLNHPHISRVLPSIPSAPVCLLKQMTTTNTLEKPYE